MLRFVLQRTAAAARRNIPSTTYSPLPAPLTISLSHLSFTLDSTRLAKRDAKGKKKEKKSLKRGKQGAKTDSSNQDGGPSSAVDDDNSILSVDPAPETYDPVIDVGPGGVPLFTNKRSISVLTSRDVNAYMDFSLDDLNEKLPEGWPDGLMKEFKETRRCALLVRQSFLDLRDNFRRIVEPTIFPGSKNKLLC